jgi:hypothetical protein
MGLHGNFCKHQIAFLLTCINFTKKYIIQYCETWYGSDHRGFAAMFANPTYLHIYDNESNDEKVDKDHFEEPWVVDMCWFMTSDDTSHNVKKEKDHN